MLQAVSNTNNNNNHSMAIILVNLC